VLADSGGCGWSVTAVRAVRAADLCGLGSVVDDEEFGLLRRQDCTTYAISSSYLTRLPPDPIP